MKATPVRILYLSQILSHDHPRRAAFPDERLTVAELFKELNAEAHVVDATCEALPDPRGYAGVMVGGSAGSANDTEPWRLRLGEWMGTWQDVPLMGICGGHQLLARVLGARVAKMSRPQVGVHPLQLPGIPDFTGWVMHMHSERVEDVPPGATLWAEDVAGIQALRYPGHRWTVQFHAEMPESLAYGAGRGLGATAESWPQREVRAAVSGGLALFRAWLKDLR
ncbi:type 1 glutamine amidotransferase [Hyalangium rubrum]|uniref:Type 1 glutamine amidotransferase n=1 Tax=Hyalangium rubrum TaxID=3103134 RepID=A0ABU5HG47_9BACT|nr:type 1 glutamine amidotransferase [Hyalangium sp. s54d21]MDY7232132.1 type 1 glutamine amidotransferase [Hyalangium sp. s54d21]